MFIIKALSATTRSQENMLRDPCDFFGVFFKIIFGCLVRCISSINAALRGTNKNTRYVEVVTSNFF